MTAQPRVDRLSAAETTLTKMMRVEGLRPGELAAAAAAVTAPRVDRPATDYRVGGRTGAEFISPLPLDAAPYGAEGEWVARRSRLRIGKYVVAEFGPEGLHRRHEKEGTLSTPATRARARAHERGAAAIHALAAARTRRQQSAQLAFS